MLNIKISKNKILFQSSASFLKCVIELFQTAFIRMFKFCVLTWAELRSALLNNWAFFPTIIVHANASDPLLKTGFRKVLLNTKGLFRPCSVEVLENYGHSKFRI